MNKKDISKALTQGSAKQRATIIAEDRAQYSKTGKGFLKDSDMKALYESFKTSAEIRIYNKYLKVGRKVNQSIPYLKQLQLLYEVSIAYLTGYSLLWYSYQEQEKLFNEFLYEVKDKTEKQKLLKRLTGINFLFATIVSSKKKGFIDIKTDSKGEDYGIEEIIRAYTERATYELREAKALAQAILDYMDEEGFNVKTYKETVKEVMDALSRDRAAGKFSKKTTLKAVKNRMDKKRIEEIFSKYWVFPDPNTEPDPERTAYYLNEYIKG
jgi:hypothetical protein